MARHTCTRIYPRMGIDVDVVMGWDVHTESFFMWIDPDLYNNLDDLTLSYPTETLEPFVEILREMGIDVPAEMFQAVLRDRETNNSARGATFYPTEEQRRRKEEYLRRKNEAAAGKGNIG